MAMFRVWSLIPTYVVRNPSGCNLRPAKACHAASASLVRAALTGTRIGSIAGRAAL